MQGLWVVAVNGERKYTPMCLRKEDGFIAMSLHPWVPKRKEAGRELSGPGTLSPVLRGAKGELGDLLGH